MLRRGPRRQEQQELDDVLGVAEADVDRAEEQPEASGRSGGSGGRSGGSLRRGGTPPAPHGTSGTSQARSAPKG